MYAKKESNFQNFPLLNHVKPKNNSDISNKTFMFNV